MKTLSDLQPGDIWLKLDEAAVLADRNPEVLRQWITHEKPELRIPALRASQGRRPVWLISLETVHRLADRRTKPHLRRKAAQ